MGLSETLKAISAPVRREILDYLKSGPKSAGEISQQFDLAPATVSHHLSTLRKAGLIEEEKQKNFIYYSLNLTVFEEILTWIQSHGGKEDEKYYAKSHWQSSNTHTGYSRTSLLQTTSQSGSYPL